MKNYLERLTKRVECASNRHHALHVAANVLEIAAAEVDEITAESEEWRTYINGRRIAARLWGGVRHLRKEAINENS